MSTLHQTLFVLNLLVVAIQVECCERPCTFIKETDYDQQKIQYNADCDQCLQVYRDYYKESKRVDTAIEGKQIKKDKIKEVQQAYDDMKRLEETIRPMLERHPNLRSSLLKDLNTSIAFVDKLLDKDLVTTPRPLI